MTDFIPSTAQAIAYFRVSTARQGQSGLGLEAQRASVASYARHNHLNISREFTEVETGTRKKHRPVIQQAIAAAKELGAVLLIAKLDRLARNVAFISALQESGIEFVAVDMPHANRLTVHIMAAIAEHEAELISQRTKAALKAAKERGKQLGTPANLDQVAQQRGAQSNKALAIDAYKTKLGYVKLLREHGYTYAQIAKRLNREGHVTRRGKLFHANTIYRMLKRAL